THHTMMEGPNIELLGQALSQTIHNAAAPSAETVAQDYPAAITLQTGQSNGKEPLFCIPGAGDNITTFVDLTMCLERRPIYGLQPRGLDGMHVPHSTVSAASETYIRAIDEIYPRGPIHLLGHSFGGWVAFDMAQRFLESGRHVTSLILLDSMAPNQQQPAVREYSRMDVILKWLDLVEQIVGHPLKFQPCDI